MTIKRISEYEAAELFNELLDSEDTIKVVGLEFTISDILKNCDSIAYRVYLSDFISGLEEEDIFVEGYNDSNLASCYTCGELYDPTEEELTECESCFDSEEVNE